MSDLRLKSRALLILSGQVQGVGFRAYAHRHAIDQGVTGYVRNLTDGTVEMVIEGEEFRVQFLIDRCVMGPPAATVHRAHMDWQTPTGEFQTFEIR